MTANVQDVKKNEEKEEKTEIERGREKPEIIFSG